jgi:hypothetical protein
MIDMEKLNVRNEGALGKMGSALFCDVTQSRVVILNRRFGKTYRSHLQALRICMDFLTLGDATDSVSRNVGTEFLTLEDGTDRLSRTVSTEFFTLEDGTDRLSRNVGI